MIQREWTPQDILVMFRRRWILITVLAVVGASLGYGVSRFIPNEYRSQTLVLVEQPTVPSDIVKPVDTTDLSQRLASMQEEILSRTSLEPLIRQFGLYPEDMGHVPIEDLVGRLQKSINVVPIMPMAPTQTKSMPGFYVSVTLGDPRAAQGVCAQVTSMFIDESLRLRQQHSEDTTKFLQQQVDDAKSKLDASDANLAAFKSRYRGSLPDEEHLNVNMLSTYASQLDAVTQALARAQDDKSFLQSGLTQQVAAWQASQSGHNPETLQQQLAALQNKLATLQGQYTDDHPDVIKTKNDIAALKKRMAEGEDPNKEAAVGNDHKTTVEPAQIAQLRAQIHTLDEVILERTKQQEQIQQQIKVLQGRVQASPAVEQEYKKVTRDYDTALGFYNDLLKKRDESEMATNLEHRQEGEQFRVLDPASLPDTPSFPNRPLFALGGLSGGLVLGLGLAFLLELRDTSLKTEKDIEAFLHLPVLAAVPAIEVLSGTKTKQAVKPQPANVVETTARS